MTSLFAGKLIGQKFIEKMGMCINWKEMQCNIFFFNNYQNNIMAWVNFFS